VTWASNAASPLQEEAYTKELAEWDKKIAERTNELVSLPHCRERAYTFFKHSM